MRDIVSPMASWKPGLAPARKVFGLIFVGKEIFNMSHFMVDSSQIFAFDFGTHLYSIKIDYIW